MVAMSGSRAWFESAAAELTAAHHDVLALLALGGPTNISNLTSLSNAAGLRETQTRKLSTTTLRPQVDALIRAGLARVDSERFVVEPRAKHWSLRDARTRGRLSHLSMAVSAERYSSRFYPGEVLLAEKALFELDAALASGGVDLDDAIDRALGAAKALGDPETVVAIHSAFPALVLSFDRDWLASVPEAPRVRLLELALRLAEVTGKPLGELYPYLLARPALYSARPELCSALFSLSLFAGDSEGSAEILRHVEGDRAAVLRAALATAQGRFAEPVEFKPAKRQDPVGATRLLQALLLLGRGGAADLAAVKSIAKLGARKSAPFRRSASWLKEMVEFAGGQKSLVKSAFESRSETDCLEALFRGTFAIWTDSPYGGELAANQCAEYAKFFGAVGQRWLADQYLACSEQLERRLPRTPGERARLEQAALRNSEGAAPSRARARPLFELRTAKARWELSLEALERVATGVTSASPDAAPTAEERILWRVTPWGLGIEPYLQTRKGNGFTRGRVGHPRVEHAASEQPVEVMRGTVQIAAHAAGDSLVVKLDPPDLKRALEVREEGARLIVYSVDEQVSPLLPLLGPGLTVPLSARERLLASLGRLAHVLPVQTSETTEANDVPPDPRVWLRIVPRGQGLLVSASARPLGAAGPTLVPGVGARRLLGRRDDEAVQTERDLDQERRELDELLELCPMLAGLDHAEPVTLEDAESCLELLSTLKRPECRAAVEWPAGKPLRLRARVGRAALRARVERDASRFFAAGTLMVDGEASVELSELVALVSESPGRFVRLSSGDFIELERDLREALELLNVVSIEGSARRRGVALSPSAFAVIERLSEEGSGFELDADVANYRARLERAFSSNPALPSGLEAELRDYQLDGFRWLARLSDAELSGCLADDMGLGKTLQAVALLLHRSEQGPALVVAPTSVCDNWRREIARFAPSLEVRWFLGPDRESELENLRPRSVLITTYTLLQQDVERLRAQTFATAVLDEAQLIKNAESQRAKAACALDAKVRFALTGTPVENHVGDLYSIFRFLLPDLVGAWAAFSRRFGASRNGEAGAQARRSLKRLLKPYLVRRTKAQVLDELPPLTEIEHRVTLGPAEAALYEGLRQKALSALEQGGADPKARLRVLAEITRLRRLCCHPRLVAPSAPDESAKLDALMTLIDELRQGRHRALVFSQFVDVLTLVRARLDERAVPYQYLDGSTPSKARSAAVDSFQSGRGDVFLISLKAGGFGLNLTAADYVIHVDPWWNPAVEAQASDRAHRIGQTRPVTVYRLIAEGTVEERIVDLHRKKQELADSLLEESAAAATLGSEELRALLET
jgi:superfamily II DNA or RNA helicase